MTKCGYVDLRLGDDDEICMKDRKVCPDPWNKSCPKLQTHLLEAESKK